ncbi:hypothetical protein M2129_002111 [Polynucleobacter sphagniphilus]|jgi:hypothetical protein|nr:hypothetical protein [Polynucleobacter sphagniphilus]MDH6300570.1 hypothetical protein [Polynucleobacter sphagniphilus]
MTDISINSKAIFNQVIGKDQAALALMSVMCNLFKFFDLLIELSIADK